MKLNKIIIYLFVIVPVMLNAEIKPSLNLDILNHQQNAISDIQYNLSVAKSDKGTGATTMRGDQIGAIEDLKTALKQTNQNHYLKNQLLHISLALLEVSNNQVSEAKKTLESLGSINSNDNPILQVLLTAYSLVWNPKDFSVSI